MSTEALQESIYEERKLTRRVTTILLIAVIAMTAIVGFGIGIVVNNSFENKNKIDCVYRISREILTDIHLFKTGDTNVKDFAEAVCTI